MYLEKVDNVGNRGAPDNRHGVRNDDPFLVSLVGRDSIETVRLQRRFYGEGLSVSERRGEGGKGLLKHGRRIEVELKNKKNQGQICVSRSETRRGNSQAQDHPPDFSCTRR